MTPTSLHIVTYHYVRDAARSRFPSIKGIGVEPFRSQLDALAEAYQMATLESALAFLRGEYRPPRDLCLLAFDDGLRDHLVNVAPLLADRRIQGVFFLITACLEERSVAPVHMNHFLTAALGFEKYRELFLDALRGAAAGTRVDIEVNPQVASRTYPWDDAAGASFKYLFNFLLDASLRDAVVTALFERHLGCQRDFARDLYLSWADARRMQAAGMAMGGHTHRHRPLAALSATELAEDLGASMTLLQRRLRPEPVWAFSYPYGKRNSYSPESIDVLRRLGFTCGLTTEEGSNRPGVDLFEIRRVDTNIATPALRQVAQGAAHAG